jgi:hypothetical protein
MGFDVLDQCDHIVFIACIGPEAMGHTPVLSDLSQQGL